MLVVLSLIFAAVTVVTTLYLPILTGNAVDMMVKKGKVDFVGLKPIVRTMLIVLVITGAAQWIMNICNNYITYHVVQDIRKDAMDRIQIVPLKYLDGHAAGDIVSRVIADADQLLRRCPFLWRDLLQRNPTACSGSSPRREVSRPR